MNLPQSSGEFCRDPAQRLPFPNGFFRTPTVHTRQQATKPTVFADCTNDMAIMREEIFGPVLSMMPFDTEEEAITIANGTDYGLTNYVHTADGAKANRVARRLRSGMVDMNGMARSSGSPFGGYKHSGNGREGGVWGLEEYLEVKAVGGWDSQSS